MKASFSSLLLLGSNLDSTTLMTSSNISEKIVLIALTSSGSLSAAVPDTSEIISTRSSKSFSPSDALSSKFSSLEALAVCRTVDVGTFVFVGGKGVTDLNLFIGTVVLTITLRNQNKNEIMKTVF